MSIRAVAQMMLLPVGFAVQVLVTLLLFGAKWVGLKPSRQVFLEVQPEVHWEYQPEVELDEPRQVFLAEQARKARTWKVTLHKLLGLFADAVRAELAGPALNRLYAVGRHYKPKRDMKKELELSGLSWSHFTQLRDMQIEMGYHLSQPNPFRSECRAVYGSAIRAVGEMCKC